MYICDVKVVQLKEKGRGVISTNFIPRGTMICEYAGLLRSKEEAMSMEKEYKKDQTIGCYIYYFTYRGEKYW